ncbi:hypothetical protein U9M48_012860 [Paspalum notatum var. saurae]|uniref:Uncharacterized protein n=1 Tax=Paspalum notatum var. saurae TaxID=547442 RepID=A0AAQ3SYK7_PASNO
MAALGKFAAAHRFKLRFWDAFANISASAGAWPEQGKLAPAPQPGQQESWHPLCEILEHKQSKHVHSHTSNPTSKRKRGMRSLRKGRNLGGEYTWSRTKEAAPAPAPRQNFCSAQSSVALDSASSLPTAT